MDAERLHTIRLALAGDPAAFERLIADYARLVYAQVLPIVRQPAEAEDIVQDTFIKAFLYRDLLREPERFTPWLLAIARNLARDHLRRRRAVVPLLEDAAEMADDALRPPGWDDDRLAWRRRLRAALALLPERHRMALTLRYFEELDYQAIGATMGVSQGALRGLLDRARQGLRRLLATPPDDRPPPA
jgi:RNA polymerase sigma-70 factor (ECF subfamily)